MDRAFVLGATFTLSMVAPAKPQSNKAKNLSLVNDTMRDFRHCQDFIEAEKACFDHFVVEFAATDVFASAPIILPGTVTTLKLAERRTPPDNCGDAIGWIGNKLFAGRFA